MLIQAALGLYVHQQRTTPHLRLWNESRWENHAISHENWSYPNQASSKFFVTTKCNHTTHFSGSAQLFLDDRPLWMQQHNTNELSLHNILWKTKHVLRVTVRSVSATVTSGHGIIFILSANVGIRSASTSAFGLELSEIVMGPYLLPDFRKTVVPGLLADVPPVVRQKLWFHNSGAKISSSGRTRHIQESGLDIKDRLHELYGRRI
jgi:hypothetical protein